MLIFNKACYLTTVISLAMVATGCDYRSKPGAAAEQVQVSRKVFPVSYTRGGALVSGNCAACPSRGTDTTEATTILYDLFERDSQALREAIVVALEDSIHKGRTPYRDQRDIEGLVLYLKHLYAPGY